MRDYVRALGLAPGVHATPCANEIKQRPFLAEEQRAKHKMFSRLIWDVAKVAKGIRILLLTAVSCCRILLPPLPLQQGERIEVRGSGTAIELKLQTLTLPSPFKRERRSNAPIANNETLISLR